LIQSRDFSRTRSRIPRNVTITSKGPELVSIAADRLGSITALVAAATLFLEISLLLRKTVSNEKAIVTAKSIRNNWLLQRFFREFSSFCDFIDLNSL
jgi:hypothetical protein